jgi:hypothetical protein
MWKRWRKKEVREIALVDPVLPVIALEVHAQHVVRQEKIRNVIQLFVSVADPDMRKYLK